MDPNTWGPWGLTIFWLVMVLASQKVGFLQRGWIMIASACGFFFSIGTTQLGAVGARVFAEIPAGLWNVIVAIWNAAERAVASM